MFLKFSVTFIKNLTNDFKYISKLTYIYKNHFLRLFKFNSYKLITFLLYTLNIYIRKAYKKFSKNNFLGTNFRKHLNNNFHENYY